MNSYSPLSDNSGRGLAKAVNAFASKALDVAGGYTKGATVEGAWRDEASGKVYHDRICPLGVACANSQVFRLVIEFFTLFP